MNIGDRVIVNGNQSDKVFINQSGRIVVIDNIFTFFGIEFDEYIGGHSCNGMGKKGHCWSINKEYITLEKDSIDYFKKELDKITL